MQPRKLASFAIFAAALGLASCNGDNNPIPSGNIRVANAIADSQPIDAEIEGIPDNIENIAFGTASGERDIVEGNYRVTLRTNTGSSTVSFNDDSVDVDDGMNTFVYAVGRIADGSQQVLAFEAPDTDVSSSQSEFQLLNVAAAHPGPLDVYVTAPGDSLIGKSPTASLAFKAVDNPHLVTPGKYRIRITPSGDITTVLFDSGPTGVDLPAATTQQFAIADGGTVSSAIFLMVLEGNGENHQIQNGSS